MYADVLACVTVSDWGEIPAGRLELCVGRGADGQAKPAKRQRLVHESGGYRPKKTSIKFFLLVAHKETRRKKNRRINRMNAQPQSVIWEVLAPTSYYQRKQTGQSWRWLSWFNYFRLSKDSPWLYAVSDKVAYLCRKCAWCFIVVEWELFAWIRNYSRERLAKYQHCSAPLALLQVPNSEADSRPAWVSCWTPGSGNPTASGRENEMTKVVCRHTPGKSSTTTGQRNTRTHTASFVWSEGVSGSSHSCRSLCLWPLLFVCVCLVSWQYSLYSVCLFQCCAG